MEVAVDTEAGKIDEELSAELQRAVESQSIRTDEKAVRGLKPNRDEDPVMAKRYKERALTVPLYINLIEEATYCNPGMTTRHLYQLAHEKLRGTGAILPTLLEVDTARRVFVVRWMRNLQTYGNYGLLTRYEAFIMRHILIEMLHGRREFPPSFVDELLVQMKRELPSFHVHSPDHRLMEVMMPKLVKSALRLRRRKYFEVRNAMRGLCQQAFRLTYEDLVEITWGVCTKNYLDLFVTRDQVCKLAYTAIGTHFKWVLRSLHGKSLNVLEKPIVAQFTDPLECYRAIGTKTVSYFHVYAKLWLNAYQRKRAEEGEAIDSDEERAEDELSESETTDRGKWTLQKRREARRAKRHSVEGFPQQAVERGTEEGFGSDATADDEQTRGVQHLLPNGGEDATMEDFIESHEDSKDDNEDGEGEEESGKEKEGKVEADTNDDDDNDAGGGDDSLEDNDDDGAHEDGDDDGESDGDSTESDLTIRRGTGSSP